MKRILLYSNYSNHNKQVVDLTIKNHYEYSSKYGLDFIYTQTEYTPYNNTEELKALLQIYDAVITIGTDILFTNFDKDIRDFIDDKYSIIIQQERSGVGVNGDFIIFNKTSTIFEELDLIEQQKKYYWSTQAELDSLSANLNMLILKPRTLQSINPTAYNGQEAKWKQGDFSVHCHRPSYAPKINDKVNDITNFIRSHKDIVC